MNYGEQTTETRDGHYNRVSVLNHSLNGAGTCDRYALDAEASEDERLAAFFRGKGLASSGSFKPPRPLSLAPLLLNSPRDLKPIGARAGAI